MILVDSSVWIDYFNGNATVAVEKLDNILGVKPICIGDLILTEVLQGFKNDREFVIAKKLLTNLPTHTLLGYEMSLKCADNFEHYAKKVSQLEKLPMLLLQRIVLKITKRYCIQIKTFSHFSNI